MGSSLRGRLVLETRIIGIAALITALVTPVAGALLFSVLDATGKSAADLNRTAGDVVEALCPLGVAIAASSIVGRDSGAELVMTTPTSYRRVLLLRTGLITLLGAMATFLVAIAFYGLGAWPVGQGAAGLVLLWAAPMIWLTAIGLLVGVATRSPAAASGIVGGVWLGQVVFSHDMQQHMVLRTQYLFMAVAGHFHGHDLTINRIALLAVGVVAVAAAGLLLGRPERFLAGDA